MDRDNDYISGSELNTIPEFESGGLDAFRNAKPRDYNLPLSDIKRQFNITNETLQIWAQRPEAGFWTKVGQGFVRAGQGISDIGQNLTNFTVRHMMPDSGDEEARTIIEAGLRRQINRNNYRSAHEQYIGTADSVITDISAGFATAGAFALTALGASFVGAPVAATVGVMAGLQEGLGKAEEWAESYAEETGDYSLQNYNKTNDIYAIAHGALSGWIESKLGVERLIGGAVVKTGAKRALRQGVLGAVGEGAEEFLQEGSGWLLGKFTGQERRDAEQMLNDATINAIYGAIVGGVMGTGMYYVNRQNLTNLFKDAGIPEAQAKELATQTIEEGKIPVVNEIKTITELENYFGDSFNSLVDKIDSGLLDAGWTDSVIDPNTNISRPRREYAKVVAEDIARQVLKQAEINHITVDEQLKLADIEAIRNIVYLKPQELGTAQEISSRIKEKKEELKEQNQLTRLGAGNTERKANLRLQIAVLQQLLERRIYSERAETRARNSAKAQNDQVVLENTMPDTIAALDNIPVVDENYAGDFVYVGNKRLPVSYKAVEVENVIPSHINGTVNPQYTLKELQNRASRGTTADTAVLQERATHIHPEELLKSPSTQSGAPLVNEQGEVIAGNGRYEIVRRAYDLGKTKGYRRAIEKIDPGAKGMKNPILVREIKGLSPEQQIAVADASNVSSISEFDHASRAKQDAKLLKGTSDIMEFANKIPLSNRQGLFLNNGNWDMVALRRRYNDAMLMWLCGNDTKTFESLVLMGKLSSKVISALTQSAPAIYAFQTENPTLDLRGDIEGAIKRLPSISKRADFAVDISTPTFDAENLFAQNVLLYNFMFGNNNEIATFFDKYIEKATANNQPGLFPENTFSKNDLYNQTLQDTYLSGFDESGTATDRNIKAVILSMNNETTAPQEQNTLFQEQLDLANENARLDDIYPEYTGETIDINGVEQTVYNSNGDRIAKSAEALRNFWNWFGDSKVVDKKGRPLIVYHGTGKEFDTFDYSKIGTFGTSEGLGFYTTENLTIAQEMAELSARQNQIRGFGVSMPLYVSIKNPITNIKQSSFDKKAIIARANELGNKNIKMVEELGQNWVLSNFNEDLSDNVSNAFETMKKNTDLEFMAEFANISGAQEEILKAVKEITGYDGAIIQPKQLSWNSKFPVQVSFSNTQIKSIYNRGTFSADTGNIYLQGRKGGAYDPELQVIVIGKDFNTGTLPHEMAHFWLNEIFTQAKSNKEWTPEFTKQANALFNMLGIDDKQTRLTVEQQERFARMTEAVIFGLATPPEGTQLPITAYLNWIPPKYESILDLQYKGEDGRYHIPLLDKAAVEFFNAWYANPKLPPITTSPARMANTNFEDKDGEVVPSAPEVIKARETEQEQEIKDQQQVDNAMFADAYESTPADTRAKMAGYDLMVSRNAKMPEPVSTAPVRESFLKPGRGRNTQQGMINAVEKYLKKNREHAEEVAFGSPNPADPLYVFNDTGLERGRLIRGVMEFYKKGSDEYAQLYDNFVVDRSLAGKAGGLNNDVNTQFYSDGRTMLSLAMETRAAIKYAGTKRGALEKFNADIDAFVRARAKEILATAPNTSERNNLIDAMIREAEIKFAGDIGDSRMLYQENKMGQRATARQREMFIAWAKREIRKMLKADPNPEQISKLITLSEKAQEAQKDLDNSDADTAVAAAKVVRDWQEFVRSENLPDSVWAKLIGSWFPRAMLMNINTHTVNLTSNTVNLGMIKLALRAQFTKTGQKVDKRVMDAEKQRIKAIYDATLMNFAQMEKPTSPSVLHGEKIEINGENGTVLDNIKKFDTLKLLGKEDFFFRSNVYVEALGYIASKNAAQNGRNPNDLFREYAKINQLKDSESEAARKQALQIANIAVFTQNGVLARALGDMRRALNRLTGNENAGLGNIIAPFVKTPANIVELGARAAFAPVSDLIYLGRRAYSAINPNAKVVPTWNFENTLSNIYFGVGLILMAALTGDYEPPYESPQKYNPQKPYDSFRFAGTNAWVKLDLLGAMAIPARFLLTLMYGKGSAIRGTLNDVPLIGDAVETYNSLERSSTSGEKALKFGINFGYNQANKAVPAIAKQVMNLANLADYDLETLDFNLGFNTGIGRKIGRQYGLDAETRTETEFWNDVLAVIFNRLKLTQE